MSTALATLASLTLASSMGSAIVVQDSAALRAAPQDSAFQQTVLWQGEMLEVRGERMDYLQVWDHRRERGGYIRAKDVRRIALTPEQAPEVLSVLKFFQNTPGAESLSIGLAAAYVQAAPADVLAGEQGAQAMDALGTAAQGMARRAMSDVPTAAGRSGANPSAPSASARSRAITLTGHMDVAADYGVRFFTYETEGSMQVCYEGTAFRQLLVMPKATAEQRVNAVLGLTEPECIAPDLTPAERAKVLQRHAQTLDMADAATVPDYLRNRLHVRRAAIWGALAFQKMREANLKASATSQGDAAATPVDADAVAMATRALTEFSAVLPQALPDADWPDYNDAAMRVNAVRWALVPAVAGHRASAKVASQPFIQLEPGQPGETCVVLKQAANHAGNAASKTQVAQAEPTVLARRCTYGVVWQASITRNKEATAMTVAVQPMEGWRELWVLRKTDQGWFVNVLPPAATSPSLGYAEWAGWVPGGQRMLVAREARGQGRYYRRTFEVVQLDSLLTEHQASSASGLPVFQRWQDANWKRLSLSLR